VCFPGVLITNKYSIATKTSQRFKGVTSISGTTHVDEWTGGESDGGEGRLEWKQRALEGTRALRDSNRHRAGKKGEAVMLSIVPSLGTCQHFTTEDIIFLPELS
jgi:hypothetical protein